MTKLDDLKAKRERLIVMRRGAANELNLGEQWVGWNNPTTAVQALVHGHMAILAIDAVIAEAEDPKFKMFFV
jgi:hypothetical protein